MYVGSVDEADEKAKQDGGRVTAECRGPWAVNRKPQTASSM